MENRVADKKVGNTEPYQNKYLLKFFPFYKKYFENIFDSPDSRRANPVCMVKTIKQHSMMYPASTPLCPGAPPNTFRGGSAFLSELP